MNLRRQLLLAFAFLTGLCALMISLPTIVNQNKVLKKNAVEKANLQVEKVYSDIQSFLTAPLSDVQTLDVFLQKLDDVSQVAVEWFLKSISKDKDDYSMVYYASAKPVSQGGFLYNDVGWVPSSDYDQTTRPWFQNALKSSNPVFSDSYVDARSGDVLVTISKSYYKNGEFLGVFAFDLSLSKLQNLDNIVKLSESGKTFMVDKDGKYVTNPDSNKIGKEEFLFFDEYGFADDKDKITDSATYIELNRDGRYFVARKMPALCGWTLVTFAPAAELMATVYSSIRLTIIFALLAIILAVATGLLIARRITKPINGIGKSLGEIASGSADLTKRIEIHSKDEVGDVARGFNKFTEKLQTIIKQVKQSKDVLSNSGQVLNQSTLNTASAITQILASIDAVHTQINNQGSSVDQTAGAVNEIASNIESLERLIDNQTGSVSQASSAVEQMIGNINSVNSSVEKMAASFEVLQNDAQNGSGKQQDVKDRISAIESQSQMLQEANSAIATIAEQTNLLAMNAAIEAAHAGEAGKGFSVVADEIRKLSETSASQSKTIGDQLLDIQNSIAEVVEASSQSSAAFDSVSEKIKETDQVVREIKASMEEQNEGSKQIIQALHNMNEITSEVHLSSSEMFEGNKMILREIKLLQDSTFNMKESMAEMAKGAEKINETGSALTDISGKMKKAITEIGEEIDKFSV